MSEPTTTKRPRTTETASAATKSARQAAAKRTADAVTPLTSEERRALIAERAYLRAEQRGFQGGDPVADWLASEREVDALLTRSS